MGQLNLRPRQSNFLLFIIIVNIMPNYTHRNGLRTAGRDGSWFLVVKSANTSVLVVHGQESSFFVLIIEDNIIN